MNLHKHIPVVFVRTTQRIVYNMVSNY